MAKRNRSWFRKLLGERKSASRKPAKPFARLLRVESLEPRQLLSGVPTLAQLLVEMTPDPHPSGDQPASSSQLVPLAYYTPGMVPPDPGTDPAFTQFIQGVEAIYAGIESNPAARPEYWGENVATGAQQYRLHLDDNGMLIENWTIDWGDGSDPQTVSPQPWVIHQYPAAGQYTILVTANSPDGTYSATPTIGTTNLVGIGGTATGGLKATMSDISPTLHVAGAQTVAQGQTFSLDNLAAFSYPNQSNASLFSYSIDWGDGSPPETNPTVTTIAYGGSGAAFAAALSAQHIYDDAGTYYLAVTVTADDGLSDTQTIPVSVEPTPSITGLPAGNVNQIGSQIALTAGIDGQDAGDTVSYSWQVTEPNGDTLPVGNNAAFTFTPEQTGNYLVNLSGTDETSGTAISPVTQTISVVAPPATPSGLTTTLVSSSEVDLQWTADMTNLAGFQVQQFITTDGINWTQAASVTVPQTYCAIPITSAQDNYEFEIEAVNSAGATSSPVTLVVLGSPTVTPDSDTQVGVSWQDLPNATGYVLQRSDNAGCSWTTVNTTGAVTTAGVTSITDSGLNGGTAYQYQVTAELSGGTLVVSAPAAVTTQPAIPSNVTAKYISGDEIDLAWADDPPAPGGFQVQELPPGGGWTVIGTTNPGQTSYVASGPFNAGETWQFEVEGLDAAGNPGPSSAAGSVTIPTGLPDQPTGLAASANSPYQVTLTWDASAGATGYTVERQDPDDSDWQDIGTTDGTLNYVDDTVLPETAYSYRVIATAVIESVIAGSTPSDSASVETHLLAPTGVQATVLAGDQIQLNWSVESVAGDGFVVEFATGTGVPSSWTVATISTIAADATSAIITPDSIGLSGAFVDGQTYWFAVGKTNSAVRRKQRTAIRCP